MSTVVRENRFPPHFTPHFKSVERVSSSSRENISSRIGFRDSRRSSSQRLRLRLRRRRRPASPTPLPLKCCDFLFLSIFLNVEYISLCRMCFSTFWQILFSKFFTKAWIGSLLPLNFQLWPFFRLHPFWVIFIFLEE